LDGDIHLPSENSCKLDNLNFEYKLSFMSTIHPAKFFALILSFFGFYLMHGAEAKASAGHSNHKGVYFHTSALCGENRGSSLSKESGAFSAPSQQVLWVATPAEGIQLGKFEIISLNTQPKVSFQSPREFYFRTGLSPPHLFV
jgi:hypothetical protein